MNRRGFVSGVIALALAPLGISDNILRRFSMGTTLVRDKNRGGDIKKLTDQQRIFVLELLADKEFSSTRAAEQAGYANPSQAANKLLKIPRIQNILGKAQRERAERLKLSGDRVLEELGHIALRDVADLCDEHGRIIIDNIRKIPEHVRRCIDGIKCKQYSSEDGTMVQEIELKLVGKLGAIELAMKHLGMLAPKQHEVKHTLDWKSLYDDGGDGEDVIEAKILAEEE